MLITTSANGLPGKIAAVCLGSFDGVHVGHQAIFKKAVQIARAEAALSAVFTFHPHPGALTGRGLINTITTRAQRARLISACGVDVLVEHPFTSDFASLSPEQFVEDIMIASFGYPTFVAGFNYTFGHKARGNIALLRELAEKHSFEVCEISPVMLEGETVSSTRVRRLIREGKLSEVERCLGRRFSLQGQVMHGDGRGRTLGFPTANVHFPPEQVLPPNGVYVVNSPLIGSGVANLGFRPTYPQNNVTLEVHFLAQCKEIYGQEIEVELLEFLRPEMNFSSGQLLREQVFKDIEQAKTILLAFQGTKC